MHDSTHDLCPSCKQRQQLPRVSHSQSQYTTEDTRPAERPDKTRPASHNSTPYASCCALRLTPLHQQGNTHVNGESLLPGSTTGRPKGPKPALPSGATGASGKVSMCKKINNLDLLSSLRRRESLSTLKQRVREELCFDSFFFHPHPASTPGFLPLSSSCFHWKIVPFHSATVSVLYLSKLSSPVFPSLDHCDTALQNPADVMV